MRYFVLITTMLFLGPAVQAEELPWPEDRSISYRFEMARHSFVGGISADAVVMVFTLDCTAASPSRRSQQMDCAFRDQEVLMGKGTGEALQVLQSYGVPEGLTVSVRWSLDRRIRKLQLRGESSLGLDDWSRSAVGAMELGAPPEGWTEGAEWKQKGTPQVMLLATSEGMGGSFRLGHTVTEVSDDTVSIESAGEALLVPTWAQNSLRGSEVLSVVATGDAIVDPRDGTPIERNFRMVPSDGGNRTIGAIGLTVRLTRPED